MPHHSNNPGILTGLRGLGFLGVQVPSAAPIRQNPAICPLFVRRRPHGERPPDRECDRSSCRSRVGLVVARDDFDLASQNVASMIASKRSRMGRVDGCNVQTTLLNRNAARQSLKHHQSESVIAARENQYIRSRQSSGVLLIMKVSGEMHVSILFLVVSAQWTIADLPA